MQVQLSYEKNAKLIGSEFKILPRSTQCLKLTEQCVKFGLHEVKIETTSLSPTQGYGEI